MNFFHLIDIKIRAQCALGWKTGTDWRSVDAASLDSSDWRPPYHFVVVALLFYVHGKHLRSYRDGQLT